MEGVRLMYLCLSGYSMISKSSSPKSFPPSISMSSSRSKPLCTSSGAVSTGSEINWPEAVLYAYIAEPA